LQVDQRLLTPDEARNRRWQIPASSVHRRCDANAPERAVPMVPRSRGRLCRVRHDAKYSWQADAQEVLHRELSPAHGTVATSSNPSIAADAAWRGALPSVHKQRLRIRAAGPSSRRAHTSSVRTAARGAGPSRDRAPGGHARRPRRARGAGGAVEVTSRRYTSRAMNRLRQRMISGFLRPSAVRRTT
jgi:hypothetical protein